MLHHLMQNKQVILVCVTGAACLGTAAIVYTIYRKKNDADRCTDDEGYVTPTQLTSPNDDKKTRIPVAASKTTNEESSKSDVVVVKHNTPSLSKPSSKPTTRSNIEPKNNKHSTITEKIATSKSSTGKETHEDPILKPPTDKQKADTSKSLTGKTIKFNKEPSLSSTDKRIDASLDVETKKALATLMSPGNTSAAPADKYPQTELSGIAASQPPRLEMPRKVLPNKLDKPSVNVLPTSERSHLGDVAATATKSAAGDSGEKRGQAQDVEKRAANINNKTTEPMSSVPQQKTIDVEKLKTEIHKYQGKDEDTVSLESAKILVYYLTNLADQHLLQRLLITIANLSAFKRNQNVFRIAGAIPVLTGMLVTGKNPTTKCSVLQVLNNLAVNERNQEDMEETVKAILSLLNSDAGAVILNSLRALTNLTVQRRYHHTIVKHVSCLMELFSSKNSYRRMQALKLLINISDSKNLVAQMLISKYPPDIIDMLDPKKTEIELLSRVLRLITNIISICTSINHDSLPERRANVAESDMLHSVIFRNDTMLKKIGELASHTNVDIRNLSKDFCKMNQNINFYEK